MGHWNTNNFIFLLDNEEARDTAVCMLLFLLPPSCMVAPIGKSANKFIFPLSFSSTISSNNQQTFLPTMNVSNNMGMVNSTGTDPVTNNDSRGRPSQIHKNWSRDTSMSSTCSSTVYHERLAMNNGMDINSDPPVESPVLYYEDEQEKEIRLRKAAETTNNTRSQGGNNEAPSIQVNHGGHVPTDRTCGQAPCDVDDNVINIQLPYDLNAPMEPDLWSGDFHSISLHGSVEQITSDMKNIKQSLNFMVRYISNKKVNLKSSNDLNDFDGIGDMVWNFLSSIYQSSWDSLYTDNRSKTLRKKISSKLTPRVVSLPTHKSTKNPNLVTINKVPLPPPFPAKTKKEVNVIFKYFLPNKPTVENKV